MNALKAAGQEVHWTDQLLLSGNRADADIILVDSLFADQFVPLLQARKKRGSALLIVHHLNSLYPPDGYTSNRYFEKVEKPLLEPFDGFLATSPFTKNYLQRNGISQPVLVVPPALSVFPISLPDNSTIHTRNTEAIRALIVGNLVKRKGILPFLKELSRNCPDDLPDRLQITILGTTDIEPDYADQCIGFLQQHPTLRAAVRYGGALPQKEVYDHYRQANLFISTSFMETYGMALQEAVAFRLPILALDRGNVSDHVQPGKNGQLFGDFGSLTEALMALANSPIEFQKLVGSAYHFRPDRYYGWEKAAALFLQQIQLWRNRDR